MCVYRPAHIIATPDTPKTAEEQAAGECKTKQKVPVFSRSKNEMTLRDGWRSEDDVTWDEGSIKPKASTLNGFAREQQEWESEDNVTTTTRAALGTSNKVTGGQMVGLSREKQGDGEFLAGRREIQEVQGGSSTCTHL